MGNSNSNAKKVEVVKPHPRYQSSPRPQRPTDGEEILSRAWDYMHTAKYPEGAHWKKARAELQKIGRGNYDLGTKSEAFMLMAGIYGTRQEDPGVSAPGECMDQNERGFNLALSFCRVALQLAKDGGNKEVENRARADSDRLTKYAKDRGNYDICWTSLDQDITTELIDAMRAQDREFKLQVSNYNSNSR